MATSTTPVEVEAVFQNGSFHPLGADASQWSEGQHVRLVIQKPQQIEAAEVRLRENAPLQNGEDATVQPRIAGLHAGMGWMSDDFNDPLPDEFWLGEE